ncbi:hypothetical protein CXB65_09875 [Pseudomonas monteilii]|uniref:Uncharacterized protein n=1 Tax=Pseudomonas monteilii TaxID=76759 RepID=A0A2N1IUY0_9PSED|nr:hypothetical protein CXB65_09875 [Pseudomonas monteilii]
MTRGAIWSRSARGTVSCSTSAMTARTGWCGTPGQNILYVYEPGSYALLARIDQVEYHAASWKWDR